SAFLNTRRDRNIYFPSEDKYNDKVGIILPDPQDHNFHLVFNASITLSDLRYEIFHFKRVFERYFGAESFDIEHQHIFQIDHSVFYDYLQNILDPEEYSFSSEKETLGFDFATTEDLDKQLEYLNSLSI